MTIFEFLHKKLREMSDQGISDAELGKRAGVSQQQINRMLNDPIEERFAKTSFKTIVCLFPDFFNALMKNQSVSANGTNAVAATNIQDSTINNSATSPDYTAILTAVMNADICPECAVKVSKAILGQKYK